MMHPHTRLAWISDAVGHGVVATQAIPAGTIVWVPDALDRRISPAEFATLPAPVQAGVEHFAYLDQDGNRVLAWDLARYVNHACAPTCVSAGYDCNVAAVDLGPGDQLTDDYGSYLRGTMACACGSAQCRGTVGTGVLDAHLISAWDARFAQVFPLIFAVDQPLWSVLPAAERARLEADRAAGRGPASIARLFGRDA